MNKHYAFEKSAVRFAAKLSAIALLFLAFSAGASAQKTATYTNPVAAGDYPDPSVIRVGKDYYATATSSEWSPEFPILHSTDLVNWKIVGEVFPKRPEWSTGNYWAPEIWQENGKIYIFYVARKAGGNLCIAVATSDKPLGVYTDHGALACQEVGSIDAFPIRDENGKFFVVWKEDGNSVGKPTPLWAQEFDDKNYKLIGEKKEILRNDPATWEGNLVEGPFIIKRGEYFYMFYSGNACCTTGCKYAMGLARSKTLLGNWERDPANPILKDNADWKCPGHGTIVTDESGKTWMLYHAYDPKDTVYVGRQALLDEVKWTADNWATINDGKGASKEYASPLGVAERNEEYKFFDDFKTAKLDYGWVWQHNNVPVYRVEKDFLILSPNASQMTNEVGAIMARSTTVGDYTATTQLDVKNLTKNAIAGISAYGDDENALGAGIKDGKLVVWKREKKNQQIVATMDAPKSKQLYLKMTARDGHFFKFAHSKNNKTWTDAGAELDGAFLPPWDRGVRVALYTGGAANASARFDFLRIEPTAPKR